MTNEQENEMTEIDTTEPEVDDEPDVDPTEETEPDEQADQFPRTYVERLRRESQGYRDRATAGEAYGQRLHVELVKATGKLADPTDLPFDKAHLDNPGALAAAIDELLQKKPHLASRRPVGDIGQGPVSGGGSSVDLAAILRQRAT